MEVNLGLGIVSGRQEAQPDNKKTHPGSWGGASPPRGALDLDHHDWEGARQISGKLQR